MGGTMSHASFGPCFPFILLYKELKTVFLTSAVIGALIFSLARRGRPQHERAASSSPDEAADERFVFQFDRPVVVPNTEDRRRLTPRKAWRKHFVSYCLSHCGTSTSRH